MLLLEIHAHLAFEIVEPEGIWGSRTAGQEFPKKLGTARRTRELSSRQVGQVPLDQKKMGSPVETTELRDSVCVR